jgi:hypothetical protein
VTSQTLSQILDTGFGNNGRSIYLNACAVLWQPSNRRNQ